MPVNHDRPTGDEPPTRSRTSVTIRGATSGRPQNSLDAIRRVAPAFPGLSLLVLHGSRARGDAHALSDWDVAYEWTGGFDPDALLATLIAPV